MHSSPHFIGAILVPVIMGIIVVIVRALPNKTKAQRREAVAPVGQAQPVFSAEGSEQGVDRLRLSIIVPILAWILLVPGVLALILGLFGQILGMAAAGFVAALFGVLFLWWYRNWYLEIWPDGIGYRKVAGREGFMRYQDIDSYRVWVLNNGTSITMKDTAGQKLSVNISMYDASWLEAELAFRMTYGHWGSADDVYGAIQYGTLQELPGRGKALSVSAQNPGQYGQAAPRVV